MLVSPLTIEFMVYAVRNLLSAAIATFATLHSTHLSPLSPGISMVPIYMAEHLLHPENSSVFLEPVGEKIKNCVSNCCLAVHC